MQPIKVSIIIPAYNCESTIVRCLDSILSQSGSHCIEIIVIDDGSQDGTAKRVHEKAVADSRILLYTKKNAGVSVARNQGIRLATGNYIMFVDGDDELKPQILDTLLESSTDADLVISGVELHQDKGISKVTFEGDYSVQEAFEQYGRTIPGLLLNTSCGKLYRKDIIDRYDLHFEPSRALGEDTLFVFQYLSKCRSIRFLNYAGYVYNQLGTSSLMTKYRSTAFFETQELYTDLIQIAGDTAGSGAHENLSRAYKHVLLGYLRKTIANRKRVSKDTLDAIIEAYLNDEIVQREAKSGAKRSAVQKVTDALTVHKRRQLLQMFLTVHISMRGV